MHFKYKTQFHFIIPLLYFVLVCLCSFRSCWNSCDFFFFFHFCITQCSNTTVNIDILDILSNVSDDTDTAVDKGSIQSNYSWFLDNCLTVTILWLVYFIYISQNQVQYFVLHLKYMIKFNPWQYYFCNLIFMYFTYFKHTLF